MPKTQGTTSHVIIVQKFQCAASGPCTPQSHFPRSQRQTIKYMKMLTSAVMLKRKVRQYVRDVRLNAAKGINHIGYQIRKVVPSRSWLKYAMNPACASVILPSASLISK